jgi:transcriptional regulator of acetoin/glycerol metabolism
MDHEALQLMRNYSWPGNVRELENAIEYAFVVCQGSLINNEDLPAELLGKPLIEFSASNNNIAVANSSNENKSILRSKEKLENLLENCNWNKAEAGRQLGVSRTAVWKWMKKHKIPL